MKAYLYNPENEYKFREAIECQRDPKESEAQGKDVWLLPADATYEEPPEAEEGYVILFRDGAWQKLRDYKGKQYWLEGEGHYDAPHTMTDYGDLPEGASLEQPAKSVAEVKEDKLTELANAFDKWRTDGATLISSLGFEADADEKANADVNGLVTLGASATFMDAHNEAHELTIDDLKVLQKEIIESGSKQYQVKWAFRDQINNAETIDELNAIEITFSPVDFSK